MKFFIIIILLFSACSPKVKISQNFTEEKIDYLAVLPAQYPADIQREKVDRIHELLIAELRSENFNVLEPALVERICNSQNCEERTILAEQYGATAFVKLELDSAGNYNFFAGRYNKVAGKLIIEDQNFDELLSLSHLESERKGLVFDSGQVLTALKNQLIDNSQQVQQRFARKIVAMIPQLPSQHNIDNSSELPSIFSKSVEMDADRVKVCAKTSANTYVNLLIANERYPLKELESGSHCAVIAAALLSDHKLNLEARSAFGLSIKEPLMSISDNCDLSLGSELKREPELAKLKLDCVDLPGSKVCEQSPNNCKKHKILVFAANTNGGYSFKEQLKSSSWTDKPASSKYQLLNISPYGFTGLPVAVEAR